MTSSEADLDRRPLETAFAGLLVAAVRAVDAAVIDSGVPHPAATPVRHDFRLFAIEEYAMEPPPEWPQNVIRERLAEPCGLGEFLEPLPPGPLLGRVLDAIDLDAVDDYSLVEVVAAYKRMEAWSAGKAAEAAAALTKREALNPTWPDSTPVRGRWPCFGADELAIRLGMSRFAARRLVVTGRAFGGIFDFTGEALLNGEIDYAKAQAIVSTLEELPADVALAAQLEVLDRAPGRTLHQVRQDLAKAVIAVHPEEADQRHRVARQQRRVNRPRALPDGMALMSAVLPAADAIGLDTALEGAARAAKNNGDQRTLDQLRADSLALMGHTALVVGHIGPSPGNHCSCGCTPTGGTGERGGGLGGAESTAMDTRPRPTGTAEQSDARAAVVRDAGDPDGGDPGPGDAAAPVRLGAIRSVNPADFGLLDAPAGPGDAAGPAGAAEPAQRHGPTGPAGGTAAPPLETDRGQLCRLPATGPPHPGHRMAGGSPPFVKLGLLGGGRADIRITVPLSVVLPGPEDRDTHALDRDPVEVAELEGYGPVPPEVARALAAGGEWRRLVTDPMGGEVLDVGRTRYQPTRAIADHVRERDRTCIRPGCTSPARTCDLDHRREWQHGGETSVVNMGPMCRRDHVLKSTGSFTVARASDGTYAWTTATDHGYLRYRDGRTARLPHGAAKALRRVAVANAPDRRQPLTPPTYRDDPATIDHIIARAVELPVTPRPAGPDEDSASHYLPPDETPLPF